MGADRIADRHTGNGPQRCIPAICAAATAPRWDRFRHRIEIPRRAATRALLPEDVRPLPEYERNTPGCARLPLQCGRKRCAWKSTEREWLRQPSERLAFQRRPRTGPDGAHRLQHRSRRYDLVSLSGRHRLTSRLHRSDQPLVQCDLAATAVFLCRRLYARLFPEPGELLQPGFLLVRESVWAQ